MGDLPRALELFSAAIAREPTAVLHSNRAGVYLALGRADKALSDASAAIEERPTWAKAHARAAAALGALGRHAEAVAAAEAALSHDPASAPLAQALSEARDRAAEIVTTDERGVRYDASTLDTDHIGVGNPNVEKLSDEPKAFLYHGFLSAEECDHLIKIGTPHLKRSTVVGGKDDTGVLDDVRTSFGTFLPKKYDDVLYGIERRVEDFSQISYENQEQLQLLKYHDGQEYKDHQDGLTSPNGGRRIATVLMFLHEPEKGGETSFPQGKPLPAVAQRLRIPGKHQHHLQQCQSICDWLIKTPPPLEASPSIWSAALEQQGWQPEAVALVVTLRPQQWKPLLRWWGRWRRIQAPQTARDLIAAGWQPGPAIGEELRRQRSEALHRSR